jgi:hypothetical protein
MRSKNRISLDRASVSIVLDADNDMFVSVAGVQIAKRGRVGTPQARTWISLEPGWTVRDCPSDGVHGDSIELEYRRARVH